MVTVKGQIKRNTVIKTLNPGNHSNKSMYLYLLSRDYGIWKIIRGGGLHYIPCSDTLSTLIMCLK